MSSANNLKLFYHNVEGLTLDKYINLLNLIDSFKYDVVILVDIKSAETSSVWYKTIQVTGYRLFMTPHLDEVDHAACVYVSEEIRSRQITKSSLNQETISLLAYKEAVWVTVDSRLLIGSVWCSSENNTYELCQAIQASSKCSPYLAPMLIGNFGSISELSVDCILFDALHSAGYEQHFDTLKAPSQLFLMPERLIKPCKIICVDGLGESHHAAVSFKLKFVPIRQSAERAVKMYEKGDFAKMRAELGIDWYTELRDKSVRLAYKVFKERIQVAIAHNVPDEQMQKVSMMPAWSKSNYQRINRMIKEKSYAFDDSNQKRYHKRAEDFRQCVIEEKRKYEAKCFKRGDYQYISEYMSALTVRDETVQDFSIGLEGNVLEDDEEMAEALSEHFKSIRVTEDPVENPKVESNSRCIKPLKITKDVILDELKALSNKSVRKLLTKGPDKIPMYALTNTADAIADALLYIFNESIQRQSIPHEWKIARIHPKLKSEGDPYDIKCYRPISITSAPCKLLERIIEKHILAHMKSNDAFSSHGHHGFKNKRGVSTNILETFDYCTEALHFGQPVDIIYLDVSKAFDTVPQQKLLNCLLEYGICGNLLYWIVHFLAGRQCFVQVRGQYSKITTVDSGVPQGSVLANLLFAIFLNKLPSLIASKISMYCDDIKIYAALEKNENGAYISSLQNDLDQLCKWAQENQMTFSSEKCKVMHLGNENPRTKYTMTIDQSVNIVAPVEVHRDLGVLVDSNLTFDDEIRQRCSEAKDKIELMKCQFAYLTSAVFKKVYVSHIREHLERQSPVWSPVEVEQQNMLEDVQRQATACVKELKDLQYNEILQKLQLPTMAARHVRADLVQMYRLMNGNDALHEDHHLRGCSDSGFHSKALTKRKGLSAVRERFFFERVVVPWNHLPENIVSAKSAQQFEQQLDGYMMKQPSYFRYEATGF